MVQATVVLAVGASVGMTLAPNAAEALPLMPETSERATTFTPFKPFGIRGARATAGGGHVLGVTTGGDLRAGFIGDGACVRGADKLRKSIFAPNFNRQ
jgi:hypothetical protein